MNTFRRVIESQVDEYLGRKAGEPESIESFLARGGRIQRIPATDIRPDKLPVGSACYYSNKRPSLS